MTKKLYWTLSALAIVIIGFVAFQIYLHIDFNNFKKELTDVPKIETETLTTQSVIVSEEKPEDVPGFNWVRHGDHWYKVPIDDPHAWRDVVEQNFRDKPNDGNEYVWKGDHWHRVPDPDKPRLIDDVKTEDVVKTEIPRPKSNLPDELPAELPTDEEMRQMTWWDLKHLHDLYLNKYKELDKIDPVASVRFHNANIPKIWAIRMEKSAKISEEAMASHRALLEKLPLVLPQTEESPAVIIEEGTWPESEEEGNQ